MANERLNMPFLGFDSIDERMKRVPNDLNDAQIRIEYIQNHIKWFLANHPNAMAEFVEEVKQKYYNELLESGQYAFIDQLIG